MPELQTHEWYDPFLIRHCGSPPNPLRCALGVPLDPGVHPRELKAFEERMWLTKFHENQQVLPPHQITKE